MKRTGLTITLILSALMVLVAACSDKVEIINNETVLSAEEFEEYNESFAKDIAEKWDKVKNYDINEQKDVLGKGIISEEETRDGIISNKVTVETDSATGLSKNIKIVGVASDSSLLIEFNAISDEDAKLGVTSLTISETGKNLIRSGNYSSQVIKIINEFDGLNYYSLFYGNGTKGPEDREKLQKILDIARAEGLFVTSDYKTEKLLFMTETEFRKFIESIYDKYGVQTQTTIDTSAIDIGKNEYTIQIDITFRKSNE